MQDLVRKDDMKLLRGIGIGGGIAEGRIYVMRRKQYQIPQKRTVNPGEEYERFETARKLATARLEDLYERAVSQAGVEGAQIFAAYQMMLEDEEYLEYVRERLNGQNAEQAVEQAGKFFADMFRQMEDPYMQARVADVQDVTGQLLSCLTDAGERQGLSDVSEIRWKEPVILAAEDLSPSETVRLDQNRILAFLTAGGSANSHTAILARTMGIPAVAGLGQALLDVEDGTEAVVDGTAGSVYLSPDREMRERFREKKEKDQAGRARLERQKGLPSVTRDGRKIMICANIGSGEEAKLAMEQDAEGIGLFRTEFVYLESRDYPDEETQFQAYKQAVEHMQGRRVIFRTLDIGADKQADYFRLPAEENPAMGMRAIRLCLIRPELFRTQLRALYRASAFGSVGIMFPMIASEWELEEAVGYCEAVQKELKEDGIPFSGDVELGVMIETPAAVMISRSLAKHVSFFSIGTNDLTQYTLAMDRQNPEFGRFFDPHHPAVLEMIRMTAENARREGIWCGICGELAGDLALTELFLEYGVDELSVSPSKVLELREKVRKI